MAKRTASVDFGDYLDRLLAARGLPARQFAAKVKVHPTFVAAVTAGRRSIPGDRIETWADALGLRGAERAKFIDEAWLCHAPEYVRKRFRELLREAQKS